MSQEDLTQKTIEDFGSQWGRYTKDDGYYASAEYFADIVLPLMQASDFQDREVLEIGSGSGRITRMLVGAGAGKILAVEPASGAFATLQRNTADIRDKIEYLNVRGDEFPDTLQADDAISIGVIHHIPEPAATMKKVYNALRPGGRCLVWLYGREGNEAYLRLVLPLRKISSILPHWLLALLCHALNLAVNLYILLCKYLPLPLRTYVRDVLAKMDRQKRYLIIYDQLNPAYAKYYTRQEAIDLLSLAGFTGIEIHHRHGYSWTVMGTKP